MGRATMAQGSNLLLVSFYIIMWLLIFRLGDFAECWPEKKSETAFCQHFVRSKGYHCEEHQIYTDDGFALLLHRVGIVPSTPESGGSSGKMGDIQYDLKVAINRGLWKKHRSRLTPMIEFVNEKQMSAKSTKDDFVSDSDKPYLLDSTNSDSGSGQQIPIVEQGPVLHRTIGNDARNSTENLRVPLQPYSVGNPIIDLGHSSSDQPFGGFDSPIRVASPDGPQQPWSSPSLQLTPTGGIQFTPYGPLPDIHDPLTEETSTFAPSWTNDKPAVDPSAMVLPPLRSIPGEIPGEIPGVIPGVIPGFIPGFIPGETLVPTNVLPPPAAGPGRFGPEIPSYSPEHIEPTFLGPVVPDPTTTAPPRAAPPPSITETPSSGIIPSPEVGVRGSCVLLLHHELLNGDSWFKEVMGGHQGSTPLLPFLLADDGFDVWVGHGRATYWGHDHLHLDSSNQSYWNWSWDEFVKHDVSRVLGYINENAHCKIQVVGVSQSAAVAVAAATQPDLAHLMRSLVLVGPTIYHGTVAPLQWQTWAGIFAKVTDGLDSSSVSWQFNVSREFQMHSWALGGPASQITGPDCCISTSVTLFDNGWDGTTSYKNFQHFMQGVLRNKFQKFDYGSPSRNQEVYGQPEPPAYSPANLPADLPVQIIHGGNDFFSSPEGVQELLLSMPGLLATVYLPLYAHFDLFFSGTRNQDVYLPMRAFLRNPDAGT